MDKARLDQFARVLASAVSRRGVIQHLTGVAMGGILVAVGASEAGARKKKRGGGKHKRRQSECTGCGDGCPGAAETNPTKTLAFTPSGDPDYCLVTVNLIGFAGCTAYTAEYWSAINTSGFRAKSNGNVILGPTDLSGSSQTTLGSYAKGGAVDIRFNGSASAYQWVDC